MCVCRGGGWLVRGAVISNGDICFPSLAPETVFEQNITEKERKKWGDQ